MPTLPYLESYKLHIFLLILDICHTVFFCVRIEAVSWVHDEVPVSLAFPYCTAMAQGHGRSRAPICEMRLL